MRAAKARARLWRWGAAWLVLCGTALLTEACSKKNNVDASTENNTTTTNYVTQVVGPDGAFVIGPGGASVDIPAGALTQEATIRLGQLEDAANDAPALPADVEALSSVFSFEPHGLTFAIPVTIELPHLGGSGVAVSLLRADPGGGWSPNAITNSSATSVQTQRTSFSYYVVARGTAGAGGSGGAGGAGAAGAAGSPGAGGVGGTGGSGAGGTGGVPLNGPEGPSCANLAGSCRGESCCTSDLVGGMFRLGRSDAGTDAFSMGQNGEQPEIDASVADFYLDRYEVSVGRFRKFVEVYDGTPPTPGAGAHPLIANTGWQAAWDEFLLSTRTELETWLACDPPDHTWTGSVGPNESKPQNCVTWYEAAAFCVWDGGRLPTEAEWEFVAAGGMENRLYPWGTASPDCSLANILGCGDAVVDVGSHTGTSLFGQYDLGGNVNEWVFDWFDGDWYSTVASCTNCANTFEPAFPFDVRSARGAAYTYDAASARSAKRGSWKPNRRNPWTGFRCARSAP